MIQIINNYAIEIILLTLTAGLVLAEIIIAYKFIKNVLKRNK